ncbi:hypothetical protein H6P81_011358 [Aristolochia fimbriata]|uniref:Uncharacterized protein n=1 Tax=Aristolochia fimbriata TaxID=158543 RepID=A0AAV7ERQ6_ARIFI|nr:hypothetical protein H6P81_011358 [Aristolochia fimbriata]
MKSSFTIAVLVMALISSLLLASSGHQSAPHGNEYETHQIGQSLQKIKHIAVIYVPVKIIHNLPSASAMIPSSLTALMVASAAYADTLAALSPQAANVRTS